ncbi:MAG: TIGR02221 family CRISPR-associated protein [Desulfococcaceae bacterium]
MRNVYLSFLGLGNINPETGPIGYRPATYELAGRRSKETPFVQIAEMEILGGANFDLVLMAATRKSHEAHSAILTDGMSAYGAAPEYLILEEDFSPEGQWKWFETILGIIEHGDRLTLDLTHGYRAVPIVFSTALNFLQKARNIQIEAVYYGAFDSNRKLSPIVNMKDFYVINEWADAVSRLVEEADARKLAEVAAKTTDFQAGELNDPEIISALDDLTNTVRNVDVNNVGRKAHTAIELIQAEKEKASETGRVLLDLVFDKFVSLCTETAPSGQYNKAYFELQIEIARLLLEHRLFMQAYTVMREFIASLVMVHFERDGMSNKKRKKRRPTYGEIFIKFFEFPEEEWKFDGRKKDRDRIFPFYEELRANGVEAILRSFSKELTTYRNGFDHAWTAKAGAATDIPEQGRIFFDKLNRVLEKMTQSGTWIA